MNKVLAVKRADKVEPGDGVLLAALGGTGIVSVQCVQATETLDEGKWVELTTDGGRKHLLGPGDRLAVVL